MSAGQPIEASAETVPADIGGEIREDPTEDNGELMVPDQPFKVTVFSKNDCPRCTSTEKAFDRDGIVFDEINVETDLEPRADFAGKTPLEHVTKTLGFSSMPLVIVENHVWGDRWTGFRPDKHVELKQILRQHREEAAAA